MSSNTHRYLPLTQQRFCCVPACVQMILYRRGLKIFSQDEIGYCLGLTVPEEYLKILPMARVGNKPSAGWGTQVGRKEYSINNFFRKYNLPLRENYYSVSKIKEIKSWIKCVINRGDDIIVCFEYGKLYKGGSQGHVSIIESISEDCVVLVEPGTKGSKYRKINLKKLINSMKSHGTKNRGGFWVISSRE